jgi:uncharacterized protein (TIGR02301 family)
VKRAVILALAMLIAAPALAQRAPPTPAPTPSPSAAPTVAAPPYETQMLRLGEIMGALTALRDVCGAGDGAEFRKRFAALMEAEASGPERKAAWAGAFNKSFEEYRLLHTTCTPNGQAAIAAFLAEANKIAATTADRYQR